MNLMHKYPALCSNDIYVAPNASISGYVELWDMASVWYGASLKGDKNSVIVSGYANIQDRAVLYTTESLESGFPAECYVGEYSSIGPGAVLFSCNVGALCRVGAGAKVLQGAKMENRSVVLPGSVVPPGVLIPANEVWGGNPAKFVRKLRSGEDEKIREDSKKIHRLAMKHADEFVTTQWGTAYWEAEKLGIHDDGNKNHF